MMQPRRILPCEPVLTPWQDRAFIEYLDALDDILELRFARTSRQDELDQVAATQEAGDTPEECARCLGTHPGPQSPTIHPQPQGTP